MLKGVQYVIKNLLFEILEDRAHTIKNIIKKINNKMDGIDESDINDTIDILVYNNELLKSDGKTSYISLNPKKNPLYISIYNVLENGPMTMNMFRVTIESKMHELNMFKTGTKNNKQAWGATLGLLRSNEFKKYEIDGVEYITIDENNIIAA